MHPAKAVGQNEMPFGRDTRVVANNIVLDRGPPTRKGEIWGSEPPVPNDTDYGEIILAFLIHPVEKSLYMYIYMLLHYLAELE